jgi:hypothetical protein
MKLADDAFSDIVSSPEWELRSRLQNLSASVALHEANLRELLSIVKSPEDPEELLSLWSQDNRDALSSTMDEVNRRVHNFISSAMSLKDHTSAHILDLYKDHYFQDEYQLEVAKRLAKNPVRNFVQCLRNYALHCRIPYVHASLRVRPGIESRSAFFIETFILEKWKRWNPAAKRYMASRPDGEVDIQEMAQSYTDVVRDFYTWLKARELEVNADQLAALESRLVEARRLYGLNL